jgi:hypothetical protein
MMFWVFAVPVIHQGLSCGTLHHNSIPAAQLSIQYLVGEPAEMADLQEAVYDLNCPLRMAFVFVACQSCSVVSCTCMFD